MQNQTILFISIDIENLNTDDKEKASDASNVESKITETDSTVEKAGNVQEEKKSEQDNVEAVIENKMPDLTESVATTPTATEATANTDMPDILEATEAKPAEEVTVETPPTSTTAESSIEKDKDAPAKDEEKSKDDSTDKPPAAKITEDSAPKLKAPENPANQIEIEDPDDYLLHLEVILKQIHERFYSIYNDTKEIPDLKIIVPKIRSEVLRNCNLVFSGLVPTNMKLQQSRAYFIAKSLGAEVSQNINTGLYIQKNPK